MAVTGTGVNVEAVLFGVIVGGGVDELAKVTMIIDYFFIHIGLDMLYVGVIIWSMTGHVLIPAVILLWI